MWVIHLFASLHVCDLNCLNSTSIMLLPMKDGAKIIIDYRTVTLIHSIVKDLANCHSSFMDILVYHAQSAFIKRISTYDIFMYMKSFSR